MRKAFIICVVVVAVAGCRTKADNRDHLLGWYKLPDRHYKTREIIPDKPGTLVFVYKAGGKYYSSAYIGMEVPLEPCSKGLVVSNFLSLNGTTFSVDEDTGDAYISVIQSSRSIHERGYIAGETQSLERIEQSVWSLDATSLPPRSNDDFIGFYKSTLCPSVAFEAQQDKEDILLKCYIWGEGEENTWGRAGGLGVCSPHSEQLGFVITDDKSKGRPEQSILYNNQLNRYEITLVLGNKKEAIRIPVLPVKSLDKDAKMPKCTGVGIPFRKG